MSLKALHGNVALDLHICFIFALVGMQTYYQ